MVWEIGPVLLKERKKKKVYVHLTSPQFIKELDSILRDLQRKEDLNLAELAKQISEYLSKMQNRIDLLHPMKEGVRGDSRCVNFKRLKDSHCIAVEFSAPETKTTTKCADI